MNSTIFASFQLISRACKSLLIDSIYTDSRFAGGAYICHSCYHVCSAGSICTVTIVTLRLPQPDMDVVNGALAADEALKVLLDLLVTVQQDVQ